MENNYTDETNFGSKLDDDANPKLRVRGSVSSVDSQLEIDYAVKDLIYGVTESPPLHVTIVAALQQALLSLSGSLIVSLLVADAVCARDNDVIKARLLTSTLFMNGITTVAMNLFGARLPLFQGASSEYIVPLLLIASVDSTFCNADSHFVPSNSTMSNMSQADEHMERIIFNIQSLQGSLMIAGAVHALLGFTGLIGFLLRFIGPITIVPTLMLIFIFITKPVISYVESSWPIAMSTMAVSTILFLYLGRYNMPIPVWTPSGGCRIIRYPVHQVFAILISILLNWGLCAILTSAGMFSDDPKNVQFKARTDARTEIIYKSPWFTLPYPGQYGGFGISAPAILSFMIATIFSVLDSVGDYYACARVCRVQAPPKHAVNRGIFIEGLCSFISGAVGCGHGTSTNGGCLGAIGVTKVASRHVFVVTGIMYLLFGLFGKFSAIFITIPYPVLGGAVIVLFGTFVGVNLSNLQVISLTSSRNLAILGLSIFVGILIPQYTQLKGNPFPTGNDEADRLMTMFLGNPNLCGTILAFVLDNTVPGTRKERGIEAWHLLDEVELDEEEQAEVRAVYWPVFGDWLSRCKLARYCPFLPFVSQPDEGILTVST